MADPLTIPQLRELAERLIQHARENDRDTTCRNIPLQNDLRSAAKLILQRTRAARNEGVIPNIYQPGWGWLVFGFGVMMFLVFLETAYLIHFDHKQHPMTSFVAGAFFVVGAPVLFLLEHLRVFKKHGIGDQYDQFKRVQDLAAKVWAGAIIVLAALYADQFPGHS